MCHETIYEALSLQGRGGLKGIVSISERPAEAADRAVPSHWEGELSLGRGGKSQIATIVDCTTRFTLLVPLPIDHKADTVRDAIASKMVELPEQLRRSLTWNQGKEMAEPAIFKVATDVAVYICDPHSPWQRGTKENTNGLLREYLPRSRDLPAVTADQINTIAAELSGRPRETAGWMTPAEKFNEFLAMTG